MWSCKRYKFFRDGLLDWIIAMSSDPKKTAALGSAANSAKAAKRAEVERTVAAARLKIQQEKAIKENAERERQRIEQGKEAGRQAQSRELALEAAAAPIRGQQNAHRPFSDVAPQPQMTKPFSECSLPDVILNRLSGFNRDPLRPLHWPSV